MKYITMTEILSILPVYLRKITVKERIDFPLKVTEQKYTHILSIKGLIGGTTSGI